MNSLQFNRHRRLRQSRGMRALVRETFLHTEDFIYPIFVLEGEMFVMKCLLCQAYIKYL